MITIHLSNRAGKDLYSGRHKDVRQALEFCIHAKICLDGIILDHEDLRYANLDGWSVRNASFKGADLRGSNMSEATFLHCDFSEGLMQEACLCYSDLLNCNFYGTKFRKTDISEAKLDNPVFSHNIDTHLNLSTAYRITGIINSPSIHPMIVFQNLKQTIMLLNHIEKGKIIAVLKHLIKTANSNQDHYSLQEHTSSLQRNKR
ncbi:MAG: hypothetical protein AUJ12_01895 [Alphaproteobacteria bacterium CG1_02_46_17]|nr:MAG: hypothetical protein AUJ12_01895 [Alphaproteobacteria bacterium CG1_02_46_17]